MSENPDHDAIIAAAAGGIASRDIAATFRIGVREVNRVIDEAAEHAFGGEALPRDIYLEKNG